MDKIEEEIFIKDREIYNLNTLITIARVLTQSLNLDRILESVVFTCFGQFTCTKAAIYLYKAETSLYELVSQKGYEDGESILSELNKDEILTSYYMRKDFKAATVEQLKIDLKDNDDALRELEVMKPLVISPFHTRNIIYGYILLADKMTGEDFQPDEINFLSTLSNLAGLAVYNAHLHELATLDQLTRLSMVHFFHSRLNEEIAQSNKFKKNLSLIMFDIDNFKKINDSYGHLTGDHVLRDIGRLVRSSCRAEDLPARYGGEEFAIILPGTDLRGGLILANRIKKTIREHKFRTTKGRFLKITCSFGVVNYDFNHPLVKDKFIEMVDQLLYYSKNHGKDCITWMNYPADEKYLQEYAAL